MPRQPLAGTGSPGVSLRVLREVDPPRVARATLGKEKDMEDSKAKFEIPAPNPDVGERIRFHSVYGDERKALVVARGRKNGEAILILDSGDWCYRHDVMFESLEDLLEAHDAKNADHLARMLYKASKCGIWVQFLVEREPARLRCERVEVSRSGKDGTPRVSAGIPCDETLNFLGLDDRDAVMPWLDYLKAIDECVAKNKEGGIRLEVAQRSVSGLILTITTNIPRNVVETKGEDVDAARCVGIRLSANVEGASETMPKDLLFPFGGTILTRSLEWIESEAKFLWEKIHCDWFVVRGPREYDELHFHSASAKGDPFIWEKVGPLEEVRKTAEKWVAEKWVASKTPDGKAVPLPGMEGWTIAKEDEF